MVRLLHSVLFVLISLLLVISEGRTTQAYLDGNIVASPNNSLLDSSSSTTTDDNDVMGLMALTGQFPVLIEALFPLLSKDPCYPQKLTWIECSNDPIRRVTALYIRNRNLYGQLPDFSSMDALETIDLHQNFLFGPIPAFLGTFPKLTYLNLANNYFTGPIPDSLSNNKKIKLDLSGNPSICSSTNSCSPPANTLYPPAPPIPKGEYQYPIPPTPKGESQFPLTPISRGDSQFPSGGGGSSSGGDGFNFPNVSRRKKSKLPVILGVTIPPGLLVTIGGVLFAVCRRRRNDAIAAAAAIS